MEPKLASKSVEVAGAEMEVSLPEKIRQQSDLNVLVSLKNTGRDNILWGQISEYRDVRLSINRSLRQNRSFTEPNGTIVA